MRERFWRAVGLVRKIIEDPKGPVGRELARIKGELELTMFFTEFNDIPKMSEYHRKAYAYLKELSDPPRSILFSGAMPSWTLGVPSVLFLYWRNSGELDKTLSIMDECLPIYARLTSGHGSGGEHIMRAEACLNRGDDAGAEALCYKAFYDARSAGQAGNCICASLVMARAAIMRGDAKAYETARRSITEEAAGARQKAASHMGELAAALLDMTLGRAADLPDWLRDMESIRNVLYIIGQPYAFALYGMMLLAERRCTELYAVTELVMSVSRGLNFLLPQVYHLIYLAAAKHIDGFDKEAADCIKDALALAMPDKIYLPFAEHGYAILPMLESLRGDFDAERIDTLAGVCHRQISGAAAVRKALFGVSSPLTHRQREIALRTREGLSAKEIAAKLFISENTVKSAQKIIYDKLNIHTKIELTKIEF
jgi:LuxR family maltose regulon positive regulatory protein